MRRANAFHILSLLLASLGSAGWAHAADVGSAAALAGAVALLLTAAAAATFALQVARREREGVVRHLRQAAAAVRPPDGSRCPSAASTDVDALGAAVDGVIAAARARAFAVDLRARDLELQLKSASLERDHLRLERDHARAVVAGLGGATRAAAEAAGTTGAPVESSAVAREVARVHQGFVSRASHELRTPLASIRAYTEMLVDGEAGDARSQREFHEVVHAEACRLGLAVDNVLTLARLEAGALEPTLRATPLSRVVDRAVAAVRPAADGKRLTLAVEHAVAGDGGPAAVARVDEDLIALAVANLLGTAVRATPDGGRVTVRTAVDPARDAVAVLIRDGGAEGPPTERLVGAGTADGAAAGDGTGDAAAAGRVGRDGGGVGLSLARHVIEAVHGGRMLGPGTPDAGPWVGFELRRAADAPAGAAARDTSAHDVRVPGGMPTGG